MMVQSMMRYEPIFLRGNFFGIKLKYYLPVEMESEKKED